MLRLASSLLGVWIIVQPARQSTLPLRTYYCNNVPHAHGSFQPIYGSMPLALRYTGTSTGNIRLWNKMSIIHARSTHWQQYSSGSRIRLCRCQSFLPLQWPNMCTAESGCFGELVQDCARNIDIAAIARDFWAMAAGNLEWKDPGNWQWGDRWMCVNVLFSMALMRVEISPTYGNDSVLDDWH